MCVVEYNLTWDTNQGADVLTIHAIARVHWTGSIQARMLQLTHTISLGRLLPPVTTTLAVDGTVS